MKKSMFKLPLSVRYERDEDAESPREWDQLGTMVCFSSKYKLGDEQIDDPLERKHERTLEGDLVILPLYLYDHSGLRMSTSSFGDSWDSGLIGWIYITYEKLRKEFDWEYITKARIIDVERMLRGEVKTYDTFLRGGVMGYVIEDAEGEVVDSQWGWYDHEGNDDMKLEAEALMKELTKEAEEARDALTVEVIVESYINGNKEQMYDQIHDYGAPKFWLELMDGEYEEGLLKKMTRAYYSWMLDKKGGV